MFSSSIFFLLFGCLIFSTVECEEIPIMRELPSEVLFKVSKPAVLECVTEGREEYVKYTWEKDGKPFNWKDFEIAQRRKEGTLVFLSPQVEDEGFYQCFAESPAGVASSRAVSFKRTYINVPNITVNQLVPVEARPLELLCPIPDAYPKPTIVWEKRLITKPSIAFTVYNTRVTVSDEGSLYFSNLLPNDSLEYFRYVCVAESPAAGCGVPLAEYYIPYQRVDTLPYTEKHNPQYVSKDLIGKVGEITEIYCITPVMYPRWFKGEERIKNIPNSRVTAITHTSGRMLRINTTTLEDEGNYSCEYNFEDGPIHKYSIHLTVVSAPKLNEKPPKIITAKLDQDIVIPCSMSGLPTPTITWTYNAKPLINDRISVTNDGLSVRSVKKQDNGYYVCKGTNEHGEEYGEIYLLVE